jgi:hypothetical protein
VTQCDGSGVCSLPFQVPAVVFTLPPTTSAVTPAPTTTTTATPPSNSQYYCPVVNASVAAIYFDVGAIKVASCPSTSVCQAVSRSDQAGTPSLQLSCEASCALGASCFAPVLSSLTGGVCPQCASSSCVLSNVQSFVNGLTFTSCSSLCQVSHSFET